jgi:hypothetical protein
MAVVTIGNYYAEWVPSGPPEKPGCGRLILRGATRLTDLYRLRTALPQGHDAEPVGEREGR